MFDFSKINFSHWKYPKDMTISLYAEIVPCGYNFGIDCTDTACFGFYFEVYSKLNTEKPVFSFPIQKFQTNFFLFVKADIDNSLFLQFNLYTVVDTFSCTINSFSKPGTKRQTYWNQRKICQKATIYHNCVDRSRTVLGWRL